MTAEEVDGEVDSSLSVLRDQIDAVDAQLVRLLGQRFALTREVGHLKAMLGLPARDDVRESHQRLRLALLAEEQGVDAPTVLRGYDAIVERVVEEHEAIAATEREALASAEPETPPR